MTLWIDLSRSLTARSQEGRTQLKIWPLVIYKVGLVLDSTAFGQETFGRETFGRTASNCKRSTIIQLSAKTLSRPNDFRPNEMAPVLCSLLKG
jgi:hypothetical protein